MDTETYLRSIFSLLLNMVQRVEFSAWKHSDWNISDPQVRAVHQHRRSSTRARCSISFRGWFSQINACDGSNGLGDIIFEASGQHCSRRSTNSNSPQFGMTIGPDVHYNWSVPWPVEVCVRPPAQNKYKLASNPARLSISEMASPMYILILVSSSRSYQHNLHHLYQNYTITDSQLSPPGLGAFILRPWSQLDDMKTHVFLHRIRRDESCTDWLTTCLILSVDQHHDTAHLPTYSSMWRWNWMPRWW